MNGTKLVYTFQKHDFEDLNTYSDNEHLDSLPMKKGSVQANGRCVECLYARADFNTLLRIDLGTRWM